MFQKLRAFFVVQAHAGLYKYVGFMGRFVRTNQFHLMLSEGGVGGFAFLWPVALVVVEQD